MAYTSHGHHIQGTKHDQNLPTAVVRCGGPSLCTVCSTEAASYLAAMKNEVAEVGTSHGIVEPEAPRGVWFVYGYDTMEYPIAIFESEILLVKWLASGGSNNYAHIMFWAFNTEFSDAKKAHNQPKE